MGCRQPSVTGKVTDSRGLDSYEIRVNSAGLWGRGNISTVLLLFRQQSRLRAALALSHKVRTQTPPDTKDRSICSVRKNSGSHCKRYQIDAQFGFPMTVPECSFCCTGHGSLMVMPFKDTQLKIVQVKKKTLTFSARNVYYPMKDSLGSKS